MALLIKTICRICGVIVEITLPSVPICIIIGFWLFATSYLDVPSYLIPKPIDVINYAEVHYIYLGKALLFTTELVLCSFLISAGLGIPLGVLIARSAVFRRMIYPLLVAFQTFPKLAIGPLFIVWFGFGVTTSVLLAFLVTFFPIMINSAAGVYAVRAETLILAQSIGLRRLQAFRYIELPQALPSIFAGLRVGATLTVLGVLVAEFLGAGNGLGYLIVTATGNVDTPLLFASLTLIGALGLILFGAVALVEQLSIGSWHRPSKADGTQV